MSRKTLEKESLHDWDGCFAVNGFIANTDYDLYRFLLTQPCLDEVNFWQPSDTKAFKAIPTGAPFFFKLKKPYYAIVGFGYFLRKTNLPAWLAWDSFGEANGTASLSEMRSRILKYRRSTGSKIDTTLEMGCLMITQPVFFREHEWIEQPRDWKANIVQGKTYDLTHGEGQRIWDHCRAQVAQEHEFEIAATERCGEPILTVPRLGQGTFRVSVLDAYGRACAVTGEHSLPALEAGHIRPYAEGGEHRIDNGLLMRADIHRLFDKGYVTVTPDYRFSVSERLRDDYQNGRSYYPLEDREIALPSDPSVRPNREFLEWQCSERLLS